MKSLCCLLCLSLSLVVSSAIAEPMKSTKPAVKSPVGLIDIGFVFKKYERFTEERESLKGRAERFMVEVRRAVEDVRALQEAQRINTDAAKAAEIQKQLTTAMGTAETLKKVRQLELLQLETKFFREVYLDVQNEVERVAKSRGLTMIFRVDRDKMSSKISDSKEVKRIINRPLVYFDKSHDITEVVLENLNRKHRRGDKTRTAKAGS